MHRRSLLTGAGALALPRIAIAQADQRPTITVAVQKISNSNTLDCLREQSNVGTRLATFFVERLIDLDYQGQLQPVPGLATAWRRIDDKTVEFDLRRGVRMHDGREFTADDVIASFSPNRMFGDTHPTSQGKTLPLSAEMITRRTKELPAEIPPVGRRFFPALDRVDAVDKYTVRFFNATPDVTLEGRLSTTAAGIVSGRAFDDASSWLAYARKPIGTGPYKIRDYVPDVSLTMDAHDDYWGGRPPIKTLILRRGARDLGPHQRPDHRPISVRLRPAARPDPRRRGPCRLPGARRHDPEHAPDDVRHASPDLARPESPPRDGPRDRPQGHRGQPVGRAHR